MHDQIVLIYLDNDPWNMGTPFFFVFFVHIFISSFVYHVLLFCVFSFSRWVSLFFLYLCTHLHTHAQPDKRKRSATARTETKRLSITSERTAHSKERDDGVYYKLKVAALSYIDCRVCFYRICIHYSIPSTPVLLFI